MSRRGHHLIGAKSCCACPRESEVGTAPLDPRSGDATMSDTAYSAPAHALKAAEGRRFSASERRRSALSQPKPMARPGLTNCKSLTTMKAADCKGSGRDGCRGRDARRPVQWASGWRRARLSGAPRSEIHHPDLDVCFSTRGFGDIYTGVRGHIVVAGRDSLPTGREGRKRAAGGGTALRAWTGVGGCIGSIPRPCILPLSPPFTCNTVSKEVRCTYQRTLGDAPGSPLARPRGPVARNGWG